MAYQKEKKVTDKVSIIIPTYNESENLPLTVNAVRRVLHDFDYEMIIVDDNSPDGTWRVAENLKENFPNIKVIRRIGVTGLSSAVLTGMAMAEGDYIFVMDSDLQHDEAILPQMIESLVKDGADICIGTRYIVGGSTGKWSKTRLFLSRVATNFAKLLLPISVSDPMSGYFGVTRKMFQKTSEQVNPTGFKILLEFLARSGSNTVIAEIPYTFRNRLHGETKLNSSVVRNYLIALFDLKFGKWVSPTFLLYSIVGASGVLVNILGFLFGELLKFPDLLTNVPFINPLPVSVLFGIELSILSNYLLNNYFTFYERRFRGKKALLGFLIFNLVSFLGLFVQVSVFHVSYYAILPSLQISPNLFLKLGCDILGILIAMFTNYFLNSNLTWKRKWSLG
ncbi:hypothetical protein CH373_18260 [Leptospira perolatii]|uniref:Glycosyltransferase family 2 protein n=1 Tax=Leptospira perolatii TaxID=2023191 RepID=A0A2M9ZI49_9LEPT|nr:glycosyltransferase family 2 protein [Leptospira perolatii]PJZ68045.1 hypothetical protein CH360_18280 [Leptospira perolatii]PJZ71681.1 hypothetical protein CH373_18260 [Leptospira perolatii]